MSVVRFSRRTASALTLLALLSLPGPAVAQEASLEPAQPSSAPSAAPAASSPDGSWNVVAFDPWGEGLVEPLPQSTLIISLLGERLLEGASGCGRFTGGWFLEDGAMSMSVSPTGFLGCSEAQTGEAIGLESAIAAVSGWRPSESGVELVDAAGVARVVLEREQVPDNSGAWSVIRYQRPNGKLAEATADDPMILELHSDGTLSGTSGCRLLEGVYVFEGANATIGPLETVGLPCEGDLGRAERRLLRALGEVAYWRRDDDTLRLFDAFDVLLVELMAVEAGPADEVGS